MGSFYLLEMFFQGLPLIGFGYQCHGFFSLQLNSFFYWYYKDKTPLSQSKTA